MGFEVRGTSDFRLNCEAVRGILVEDELFFADDALANLRDEAIDEHRRGRTGA